MLVSLIFCAFCIGMSHSSTMNHCSIRKRIFLALCVFFLSLPPPHTFMFWNVQSAALLSFFPLKRVQLRDLKLLVITCFTPLMLLYLFWQDLFFSLYLLPLFKINEMRASHANMVVKITTRWLKYLGC